MRRIARGFGRSAALLCPLWLSGCLLWTSNSQPETQKLGSLCQVLADRPGWDRAVRRTWQRWETPPWITMAFVHQESRFDSKAVPGSDPKQAGAYGFAQVIDSTWENYKKSTGKQGAKRDNFGDAVDFIGWYNKGTHEALGIRLTDARRLYLAYHEGRGGYKRGSYKTKDKAWLREVAHKVAKRADAFHGEYFLCTKRRRG